MNKPIERIFQKETIERGDLREIKVVKKEEISEEQLLEEINDFFSGNEEKVTAVRTTLDTSRMVELGVHRYKSTFRFS